jgi:hypothetical protein
MDKYISKYKVLLDIKCKKISRLLQSKERVKAKRSFTEFHVTRYVINKGKRLINEYAKELLDGTFG